MSNPLDSHWTIVKIIIRYLKGFLSHGIRLTLIISYQPSSIRGFCDVDWALDVDDKRSTSGATIYLGPNLISWWSRKQQLVAWSSTEVEYKSLIEVTTEILWIQELLSELGISYKTPMVFCDNKSVVALPYILYFIKDKTHGD